MTRPDSLFAPFATDKLRLKNRVVMAPMTRNFAPAHIPTQAMVDYYRRRAEGGVGLIISEGTSIGHSAASGYPDVPSFYGEEALAGWQRVVDAVHGAGGKFAPQLWHVGGIRRPGVEPGGDTPGYSPSGQGRRGDPTGHAMSQRDIDEVIAAYAKAAEDAKRIGCDAIELHAAHGYLIDQFFWAETNLRTDAYGGDIAKRSRFAAEVIGAVRAAVGEGFPIILRISQWKAQNYDARMVDTPQELEAFLAPLVEAGVDIFHCSTRRFWQPEFADSGLNLAGWTRKLTGIPTITVGSVGLDSDFLRDDGTGHTRSDTMASLENLLGRLDRGEFDLVAVGRALIANPDWANQVAAGRFSDLAIYQREMLQHLA